MKMDFFNSSSELPPLVWISSFLIGLMFLIYLMFTTKLIIDHQRNVKNEFSFTEKINLKWLKYLTLSMILIYVSITIVGSVHYSIGIKALNIDFFVYTMFVLFVFGLRYFGIKQQNIFTETRVEKQDIAKKIAITEQDKNFAENLLSYMNSEKPYLNEQLTLQELSKLLDIKPYYISFVLNHIIHKNFYDFVNNYRVAEVKNRIDDGEISKFTLLSIAYNSGFNSKSSFNRIFKKSTGIGPSEYMHSAEKKN